MFCLEVQFTYRNLSYGLIYGSGLHIAVWDYTLRFGLTFYGLGLHRMVWAYTVWFGLKPYGLHFAVLAYTLWCGIALYGSGLQCMVIKIRHNNAIYFICSI